MQLYKILLDLSNYYILSVFLILFIQLVWFLFNIELDAYGSMVSVLRAQGPFTSEKQKLLQELAKVLHISNERHRAEVRRAVNDEKLATIAEQ